MTSSSTLLMFLKRIWDPRPGLASQWLEAAEKYEEGLRTNPSFDPQIVEAVIQERDRIKDLFMELLPEFGKQISVVPTSDAGVEHCAVFVWKERLYVLVSGALIGRPYDYPKDSGIKAWQWLARHEIAHVHRRHLSWFFHTRRLFRLTYYFLSFLVIFLSIFASKQTMYTWLEPSLWLLGGIWLVQTTTGLALEWQADLVATRSIKDPSILKEAERLLFRMTIQARQRGSSIVGWIRYAISMVFIDPHPPLRVRVWLLRRRFRILERSK